LHFVPPAASDSTKNNDDTYDQQSNCTLTGRRRKIEQLKKKSVHAKFDLSIVYISIADYTSLL
jgi:hypothetical protein